MISLCLLNTFVTSIWTGGLSIVMSHVPLLLYYHVTRCVTVDKNRCTIDLETFASVHVSYIFF